MEQSEPADARVAKPNTTETPGDADAVAVCPECGTRNPADAISCGKCFHRLRRVCRACRHRNPPHLRNCEECGTRIERRQPPGAWKRFIHGEMSIRPLPIVVALVLALLACATVAFLLQ